MPRVAVQNLPCSLRFDGASTSVVFPGVRHSSTKFSFGYSVRPATAGFYQRYVSCRGYLTNGGFEVEQVGTNESFHTIFTNSSDASIGTTGSISLPVHKWSYVSISVDGDKVYTRVNGSLKDTTTLTGTIGPASGQSLALGVKSYAASMYGNMFMCNFSFENGVTWSEAQVRVKMNSKPNGGTVAASLTEGSGSTAYDISGNNNHGTITNGAWSTDTPSKLRTVATNRVTVQDMKASLFFNGGHVSITQNSNLPLYRANGYGFFTYFKPVRSTTASDTIISEGNSTNATQFFTIDCNGAYQGKIRVKIVNDAGVALKESVSTTSLALNTWHRVLWSDINGRATLYINGVADATDFNYVPSGTFTFDQTSLGSLVRTIAVNNLKGYLARSQFFSYAPTPMQAMSIMNGSLLGNIGSYALEEGVGLTAYDSSGNSNHGTLTDTVSYVNDVPAKKRQVVGGNLLYNGDNEFVPPSSVLTTTSGRYVNGDASGSATGYLFNAGCLVQAGSGGVMFDNSIKHSGVASQKISTTDVASRILSIRGATPTGGFLRAMTIPADPSTSYFYGFYMKTTVNSGTANSGAYLQLNQRSLSGNILTSSQSTKVKTTTDWTYYSGTLTTNSDTGSRLTVDPQIVGNDGAATLIMDAWFDDITLTKTTPDTRGIAS